MTAHPSFTVATLENAFQAFTADRPDQNWQASVLAADEQGTGWLEGEALLDQLNFATNLVPVELGGGWAQMDHLMDLYRALYRRDPCLGLGYSGTAFIACCNIWSAGTDTQKKEIAELLKANGKLACSYYEPAHGNDLAAVEFHAHPTDDSLILSGRKEVTTNIKRARAAVVFARISDAPGSRSHSQLLLFKDQLPPGSFTDLDRHNSVGMRGIQLGGFELDRVKVPNSVILGTPGQALETTMRSFQVTRSLIPGMFAGALDSALRLAFRFCQQRHLHGKNLSGFSNTRFELVMAYLDTLLIDSISRLGARSLQAIPEMGCLYAPAIKIAVPHLLLGAMDRLATLLGASFYRREGPYGLFQKLFRDTKPVGFAHVGRPACQLTLLPLLHLMARKKEVVDLPSGLTDPHARLNPLDFDRLRLNPTTADPVLALIDQPPVGIDSELARVLQQSKVSFFDDLRAIKPTELTAIAPKRLYELSSRYAELLTLASCLAWHNQGRGPLADGLSNALIKRQLIQSNQLPRDSWTDHEIQTLFEHFSNHTKANTSFDLVQHPLTGWETP